MLGFNRNGKPELSERRKALIAKSGSATTKEWWWILLAIILMVVVLFNFSDTLAKHFPSLDADSFLIAIPFSIAVGVFCHKWLVNSMKSVEHATEASDYLEKDSVDVPERTDTFVVYKSYKRGHEHRTSYDPNEGDF